jgi:hypothetical protein
LIMDPPVPDLAVAHTVVRTLRLCNPLLHKLREKASRLLDLT